MPRCTPRQTARRTARHDVPTRRAGLAAALGLVPLVAAAALLPGQAALAAASGTETSPAASSTPVPLSTGDRTAATRLTRRATASGLGPDLAGIVIDARTGRTVWSRTPRERQIPASTVKLVTAVTALATLGPRSKIRTRVVQGDAARRIVLVGAGDPSLSSSALTVLAARTAASLQAADRDRVSLYMDDSLFPAPSPATGWKASYVPAEIAPVRALVVDRRRVADTSADALRVFATKLRAAGVQVSVRGRTRAAAEATELGRVASPDVASLVAAMLRYSRNDYAEALHRLVALESGRPATWGGARAAQRAALAALGVDLGRSALLDGSGLSRANRLSPALVARVLALALDGTHPDLAAVPQALAISGRTGTLAARFRSSPTRCAAGQIEAKTGTLNGVVALSGFTQGRDGETKIFSFLLNRVPSASPARQAVDRLATTVTGCW